MPAPGRPFHRSNERRSRPAPSINGISAMATFPLLHAAEAVYTDPGNYTVTLTVQDGGQSFISTHTITVYQSPVVAFAAQPSLVCLPAPVVFSSSSTPGSGTIASYLWDFGDGNTQQSAPQGGQPVAGSVSHVYPAAGNASVSLTVTNSFDARAPYCKITWARCCPRESSAQHRQQKSAMPGHRPGAVQQYQQRHGSADLSLGISGTATVPRRRVPLIPSARQRYDHTYRHQRRRLFASDTQTHLLNVANYQADFVTQPARVNAPDSFVDKSIPAPDAISWQVDGVNAGAGSPLVYSFATKRNPYRLRCMTVRRLARSRYPSRSRSMRVPSCRRRPGAPGKMRRAGPRECGGSYRRGRFMELAAP